MGDTGYRFNVDQRQRRVSGRFDIHYFGFRAHGGADFFRLCRIDEADVNPKLRHAVRQKRVGAAVNRAGGNDMVALLAQRQQRGGDGRNTGCGCQPGFTSFQYRQLFLQRIGGGVTQTGVNVPGLLERKAGGTLFGAVKNKR